VAVTKLSLLLVTTDLAIASSSLSTSVKTLLKSILVSSASSSTETGAIAFSTTGASSIGLIVILNRVSLIFPSILYYTISDSKAEAITCGFTTVMLIR
jgi:hypothetical protein